MRPPYKMERLVWESTELIQSGKLLMLAMAHYSTSDGWCCLTQDALADVCGLSTRHVQRLQKQFCRQNWLIKRRVGRYNVYLVILGMSQAEKQDVRESAISVSVTFRVERHRQ